jgi:hypothetical protein
MPRRSSQNTRRFLADTLQELAAAQIQAWVFGGWAEELQGLRPPGPHGDIDLLYPAEDFGRVDRFLQPHADLEEVPAKRFVHKRACVWRGVLIEIFLLPPTPAGFVTNFFGLYPFRWPDKTLSQAPLLSIPAPVASPAALRLYREQHKAVEQAYRQYLALKENSAR